MLPWAEFELLHFDAGAFEASPIAMRQGASGEIADHARKEAGFSASHLRKDCAYPAKRRMRSVDFCLWTWRMDFGVFRGETSRVVR